ncbi:hypothetical protein C8258_27495 [Nocardia sp. MDA0666]|nr:hypothetical protein C8258_27495 [Nocardia sp. MDA0666]
MPVDGCGGGGVGEGGNGDGCHGGGGDGAGDGDAGDQPAARRTLGEQRITFHSEHGPSCGGPWSLIERLDAGTDERSRW